MKSRKIIITSSTIILLFLSGCTGLRKVGDGRHLYTGNVIHIDSAQFLEHPSTVKSELDALFPFEPNTKLFWMRPLLCLHNWIAEPKNETGFWHWVKYKLGEPPSMLDGINLPNLTAAMENRLQNRGHFSAIAAFEVDSGKKTARVKINIKPGSPYTLNSIRYPEGTDGILWEIHNLRNESILKQGNIYNLKDFERERTRIDSILKEKGYYYFNPDYLLFTADTTIGSRQINVWLQLKPEIPPEAVKAFRFNNISLMDDYKLQDYNPDTVKVGDYYYMSELHSFYPKTILNSVFFVKDSLYSRSNHFRTIRHLMGTGVYKFAIARFAADDSVQGKMNVNILLTPFKKISLSAEVSVAAKTTGFAGPGLKLNYKDRNFFKNTELFSITLGGNFETQFQGDLKGQTSYQVTLDASLTLPKFVPVKFLKKDIRSIFPKTIISTGIGTYSRVSLYEMRSFSFGLTYNWKRGEKVSHFFKLIDVSYTKLVSSSEEFEQYLEENPTVKKSYEEQFILGGGYTFIYNDFNRPGGNHNFYVSESIDYSGNLASLIGNITNSSPLAEGEQRKLLGVPYSQFIRIRNEERYFYNLTKKGQLGMRLIIGAGIPYKNSSTMPYNRQFFAGGPSNVRAFLSRSLGPGTYQIPDSLNDLAIDQAGDITLESTLEYRFNIISNFKGALFTDAGNVWLINEDPERAGGRFNSKTFYKELAVGSGLGLRLDFTFIILRVDAAIPLRKPWLPEGDRWVIDKIAIGNASWRHDNLVWSIAIGYPF